MSKTIQEHGPSDHALSISKKNCKDSLRKLQIELVKLLRHFIEGNDKILIIMEGRGARLGRHAQAYCPAFKSTRNSRRRPW